MPPSLPQIPQTTFDSRGSNVWYLLGCALLFLGLIIRFSWYPVVVSDYTYFGKPWFDTLATHPGLTAFRAPFADYAPLYLYLLKFLTLLPFSSLASEKTLSLFADVLIAYLGYRILGYASERAIPKSTRFLGAVALFSLPTIMINSSLWAQSDSLYASGIMASLLSLTVGSPLLASIAFGLALSLKQQAIFFAPILIGYLLRYRRTWTYVLIPPAIFAASIIPAWLGGGPFISWLFIYAKQAGEYPWLSVSAQSAFAFLQPLALSAAVTNAAFWIGVGIAALVAAGIVYRMLIWEALMPQRLVLASLAAALVLPYVLPRMHERYFYLADLFSVLYAFYYPQRWWVPLVVVVSSLLSYMPFLAKQVSFLAFAQGVDLRVPAALLLVPIAMVVRDLLSGRSPAPA